MRTVDSTARPAVSAPRTCTLLHRSLGANEGETSGWGADIGRAAAPASLASRAGRRHLASADESSDGAIPVYTPPSFMVQQRLRPHDGVSDAARTRPDRPHPGPRPKAGVLRLVLMAVLSAGAPSLSASASPLTLSSPTLAYSVSSSAATPLNTQVLQFGQFDSAMGTLLGVRVVMTYDGTLDWSVGGQHRPGGASVQTHGLSLESSLSLSEPSLGIVLGTFAGLRADAEAFCTTSLAVPTCQRGGYSTNINNLPVLISVPPQLLSSWIGSGSVSLGPTVAWSAYRQAGDPMDAGSVAQWTGTMSVEYLYDTSSVAVVPEPAAFLLVGTGLLFCCRRFGRSSRAANR